VRLVFFLLSAAVLLAQETTAEKMIEAGHWKRARALVEQRLREAPEDPNANFLASQIRNAFGDHAAPLGLAEKAVHLSGGIARYHRQLAEVQGVMAQRANVFEQVILAHRFRKEIESALSLDPRDVQAWRDLMELYLLAPALAGGDSKKAVQVAQQIAAIDSVEGFLAQARIAEWRKDNGQTEAMLRRATDDGNGSYKALMALARFYLAPDHRNAAAAEDLAKRALAIDRGRIGGYCVLAVVYAGRADWTALENVLSSAAHEVPDDLAPYYRAAERLLSDNRDPGRSERYLRVYLAHEAEGNQPSAAEAHWELGLALRAQGQDAEAVRERNIAAQLDPTLQGGGDTAKTARTGGAN
jgi:tetratricopeptide (TPR) repeat protein